MLPAGFEIVERGQREQRTAPDPVAAQLREALQASFDIIARLAFADDVDPEPVEDEEIEAARRLGQRVLMETAALFRTPEGEKRSEEHTSELQSLMRISYAVFCLKKKKINKKEINHQKYS